MHEVILPLAFVLSTIRPGEDPLTISLIFLPLPLILLAIQKLYLSLPMSLPFEKFTFIRQTWMRSVYSIPSFLVVPKLSFVSVGILELVDAYFGWDMKQRNLTLPILLILDKSAGVDFTIWESELALAALFIILSLTSIWLSIFILIDSVSILLPVHSLAFISIAVGIGQLPLPMSFILLPVAIIDGSIEIGQLSLTILLTFLSISDINIFIGKVISTQTTLLSTQPLSNILFTGFYNCYRYKRDNLTSIDIDPIARFFVIISFTRICITIGIVVLPLSSFPSL